MTILGIESVDYGVDDIAHAQFYRDFGLPEVSATNDGVEFRLAEGSRVRVLPEAHPELPPRYQDGNGVRCVYWGVDSESSLGAIASDLGRDRDVVRTSDAMRSVDEAGIPLGFRVWRPNEVHSAPSATNAPGVANRINQHRKWFERAIPRVLLHAVFRTPDPQKNANFYIERLGFRLSDISRGLGVFIRADGNNSHHNLFFMNGPAPAFDHVCFAVEDIDELMVGANFMQRRGYQSNLGVGRHRIASSLFYYVVNPCGGEAEYGADSDVLDDAWIPREFEPAFGGFGWVGQWPEFLPHEVSWDVKIAGKDTP